MLDPDCLGRLIAQVGRSGFGSAYVELARQTLGTNECSAFVVSRMAAPRAILLEGADPASQTRAKILGSSYVRDGYRHDPQIGRLANIEDLDVRIVGPSDFSDPEYRYHYYEEPNISGKISVLGRWSRKFFMMEFYQPETGGELSIESIERATILAKFLLPALYRHTELTFALSEAEDTGKTVSDAQRSNEMTLEHLATVLVAEGSGLTPREAQVCASIVLGYRTLAISMLLGISENTICTHRKRAYAKLRITSQNELFARYFRMVSRHNLAPPDWAGEPTRARMMPARSPIELQNFELQGKGALLSAC